MAQKPWCFVDVHPNLKVKIDQEDLARVSAKSWRVTQGTTGRNRVVTSIRGPKGVRQLTLGRFLMDPPPGLQVYPRRFNEGLDYRKDNLVVCTLKERQRLLPKNRRAATSTYRGVSFVQAEGKFRAAIEVDGQAHNLGSFATEAHAAIAYNEAALRFFGPNAYQNPVGRRAPKRDTDRRPGGRKKAA